MSESGAGETGMPGGLSLADLQHWTWVIGRAQQMMMEFWTTRATAMRGGAAIPASLLDAWSGAAALPGQALMAGPQARFWSDGLALWQKLLEPAGLAGSERAAAADRDPRFSAPQWRDNPVADLIRQSYLLLCEHLLGGVEAIEGIDDATRGKLRFRTRQFVEALSPSNFAATNPQVWERAIATRGESLLKGLENMLGDLTRGQMTQSRPGAFELGRDIAATPGKVIRETPLYQLIQYAPATGTVAGTPLVIFPPWINRFYILDLGPKKSFVAWAVDQGLSVFMVSWRSADETMVEVTLDDYVAAQIDAIDTIRDLLDVPGVHAIGYCVAGTTLAATMALLAARGQADKLATATFFTAQVDFAEPGELKLFTDVEQMALIATLAGDKGYLDGRYMAMTFNLLRGRDLIWNYVVNNYLLGQDYTPFDLLHWNADYTNLPGKWHRAYIEDFYRDNRLVEPGGIIVDGTPIDLTRVTTACYVQAGREDHIAPAPSVWKLTQHFAGPIRFVLAGSGHIAGVVNHPAANKYQYWTNDAPVASFDEFVAGAVETKGSWWPDWRAWLAERSAPPVLAQDARIPGEGGVPAIEDAPGRYVTMR